MIHFSAANPERIKDFLEQKDNELNKEKELVNKLLPTLLLKYKESREDTDVEVFYGWEGMKTVYTDIAKSLRKGDENYIFGASKGQAFEKTDRFFTPYYKLVEKSGYKIKIIFNENVRDWVVRTGYLDKSKLHEVRYLHQDTFTEINFYKDTVLFVMLLEKPIVIRVRSKEAANSFKKFFETMWKLAKP